MNTLQNHTGCPEVFIEELKPHPANPNSHPIGQINLMASILKYQGWRSPIVVSSRSNFIVAGHGRYLSALQLGLSKVPVSKQPFESEEQEIAHMLADNRIAELAVKDLNAVKDLILHIDSGGFNMDLTGFQEEDLNLLFSPPKDIPNLDSSKEAYSESDTCEQCQRRVQFLE
jgi:ParB-like chromosome segregation protein Spo0J